MDKGSKSLLDALKALQRINQDQSYTIEQLGGEHRTAMEKIEYLNSFWQNKMEGSLQKEKHLNEKLQEKAQQNSVLKKDKEILSLELLSERDKSREQAQAFQRREGQLIAEIESLRAENMKISELHEKANESSSKLRDHLMK